MALIKGKDGLIQLGSSPTAVSKIKNFTITETTGEGDASVMGSEWTDVEALQNSWEAQAEVLIDTADGGQAEITIGATVACVFLPQGAGSGNLEYTGSGLVTNISESVAVDSLVTLQTTIKGKGALTRGTVA